MVVLPLLNSSASPLTAGIAEYCYAKVVGRGGASDLSVVTTERA